MLVALTGPLYADGLSKSDIATYRAAFAAADKDRWSKAAHLGASATEKLPAKVLQWLHYRAANSGVDFAEIARFIRDNPDWPGQSLLRRRAEEAITDAVPESQLAAWFAQFPPITAPGSVRYARLLIGAGRVKEATAFIRNAWKSLNMTAAEENSFRREFRSYLRKKDHIARLDRLIWDQQVSAARRQMRRVGRDYRHLAEARLMLMQRKGGVDNAIDRVPTALRNDPGLVYERLRWRRRKDFTDSAIELLQSPSHDLERPDKWWVERAILARDALRDGDISEAYRIARDHGPLTGAHFAEAEWLAGWIALRFLRDNDVALSHFRKMYDHVHYPISLARGAYWAGRAADASGIADRAAAQKWYGVAAEYFTTYYGQLAMSRLSLPPTPLSKPALNEKDLAAFDKLELVRIARMLAALKQDDLVETFLKTLMSNTTDATHWALIARLTDEIGRKDLSVRVAKRAIRDGVVLPEAGYPSLPVALDVPANPILVHAVIRQESAFDANAISSAGARGLMQLMPSTARLVARQMHLHVRHSYKHLISDPAHNLNIGSTYLSQMIDNFDGSIVLALAAYNAGPARVRRWLTEFGDPRSESLPGAVDWVESIPYRETRNYVQRVLENLPVYGYRLRDEFDPVTIVNALTGSNRVSVP